LVDADIHTRWHCFSVSLFHWRFRSTIRYYIPAEDENEVCRDNHGLAAVDIAELAILHADSRSVRNVIYEATVQKMQPTRVWVAAPANAKLVMSQLELLKASNSDAIVECVARSMEPSV